MVKKIIALGLLLAVSTAVSAVPPRSENWQSESMIKAASMKLSDLDAADADVARVTPANQKLEKDSDSKGVKSSYFTRAKDTFVNFVTKVVRGFCSLFSF